MSVPLERLQGKYEILDRLKDGGMGTIYKVRHRLLDELRVIKVMRPQVERASEFDERFRQEAKMAIRLRHENIAQFYDFSVDDEGNAFIVMEFIDGINLQDLLRRSGAPALGLGLEIARQGLKAIGYLHRKGIVHRDISPDNLMLTRDDDGNPLVKLIDLGVAKAVEGGGELTTTGIFIGKLRYCSPEQLKQEEGVQVTPQSDLYSFAVVLYELLTGRLPIRGNNLTSIISGHLYHAPVPFSESDPDECVPDNLRRVILRSLAKDPVARHESAREMARELATVQTRFPFAAGELEALLATPEKAPPTEVLRPGSTQGRLDANFAVEERSPAPVPAPTPEAVEPERAEPSAAPEPSPPAQSAAEAEASGRRRRVDALFSEANRLSDQGHLPQAAFQLQAILQLAPEHSEAKELLGRIEAQRRDLADRQRRASSLTDVSVIIRTHLDAGEMEAAADALEAARERFGDETRLDRLSAALEQLHVSHREEEARALLLEARILTEVYQYEDALAKLERAQELVPDDGSVVKALAETRRAHDEHVAQEERDRQLSETAQRIEGMLEAGDLDGSVAAIDVAEGQLGQSELFTALRSRAETIRQREREVRVAGLLRTARTAVEEERFTDGIAALEEALEANPADAIVLQILEQTRAQAESVAAERRYAERVAAVEAEVSTRLSSGDRDGARQAVRRALDEAGERAELIDLRCRVDDEIREQEARERCQALLTAADESLAAGDLAGALEAVAEARKPATAVPDLVSSVEEAEVRVRAAVAEQQKRRELETAVAGVETRIADGRHGEARRALELAEKLFAGADELAALRSRLADLERREAASAAGGAVDAADREIAEGRIEKAISLLAEALTLTPGDRAIEAKLTDVRRLQAEAAIALDLERGDLERAARGLRLARRMFGLSESLDALEWRIKEAG